MTGTPLIDLTRNNKDTQRPSSAGLVGYVENREQEKAAAKTNRHNAAMQAEIDRRMMAAQQRQMMEMQQMGRAQSGYGTPPMMATPQGFAPGYAYPSPSQAQMFQQQQQQQQGYFPSQAMSPGWGSPSPPPMPGQFIQTPLSPPLTQPYGASFDQAQAAARFAHQQGQQHRR
jgi:CCR4-NOT transcriptional complex subunit CAF120